MLAASEPWPSRQVLQEGGQILHGLVLYFDSMFMACVVTFHCHVLPQHATTCVFFKHMSWQFSIELSSSKAPSFNAGPSRVQWTNLGCGNRVSRSTDSTNWAQLGPWVTGSPSNFSSGTGALHPGATGSSDPAHGSCSASEKTQKSHGFLDRLVAWYKG